ncbi:S8 family peptidase [Methanocella arvoryzae]|nr:S8 family serine peptidase [Methanocella arvoryzae]
MANNSRVESVKKDTYMFLNKTRTIQTKPEITYPEELKKKGIGYKSDRVTVGFWKLPASLDEFGKKYGGKLVQPTDGDLKLQSIVYETDNIDNFINKASSDPYVSNICPAITGHIDGYSPNDPGFTSGNQNYLNSIYVPDAWNYQKGDSNIIVAVLDTGVWSGHPDLTGRILSGYNFISNNANTNDDNGHGTMMSGIIAATIDNGVGIAGVSQSRILPVKIMDSAGSTDSIYARQGVEYAASHGARVISMSFEIDGDDPNLRQAIDNAYGAGCVLVASTGNTYPQANSIIIKYPAGYGNVIAVGAIDNSNNRMGISNYGPHVDVVAPGVQIACTQIGSTPQTQYGTASDTSPAAALVSGVAALVVSQNPSYSSWKVGDVLRRTAIDLGPSGFDNEYGYGKVNAYSAVTTGTIGFGGSGSLPAPNYYGWCTYSVPVDSYTTVVMVGNENADFDIYAKWNSLPTTSSYDAKSDSVDSLERLTIKGSGTLYVMVISYSGSGNFKLYIMNGNPSYVSTSGGIISAGGTNSATFQNNGEGRCYTFNSGPDGSNFNLYLRWNAPVSTTSYDATGQSIDAQEIALTSSWGGTLNNMIYAQTGGGEYRALSLIY